MRELEAYPEPIMFDVGVTVLALAETPVSEEAEQALYAGISGEIDVAIPTSVAIGTEHMLSAVYGFSHDDAGYLVQNFLDAGYLSNPAGPSLEQTTESMQISREHNLGGWDAYYAQTYQDIEAKTLFTTDGDFQRIQWVNDEVILDDDQFEELNEFINNL